MPVIRIIGEPAPAAVRAVVLNSPRVIVCVPLTAALITVCCTSSTLADSFCSTDPETKVLAAGILYQPRLSCSVVESVTDCTCATSRVLTGYTALPIVILAPAPLVLLVWRSTVRALALTLVTAMTSYTLAVSVCTII